MGLTVKLFSPHIGQREVIDNFSNSGHKFGVVSCGRQFGKSLLASNVMTYWLLNNNGAKGGWVSPIYNQSKKVYKEIVKACNEIITSHNGSDLIINFANGSTLQFLSSERADSIRGFSFNYLIIDEAAYVKDVALQEAILPTLTAIGKKCLIISTPKGKGNWFYNYWLKGQEGSSDYISFSGKSLDNPYVDENFINEQRKSLPPDIFEQEYLAAFKDSGNDVFTNLDYVCTQREWPEYRSSERYFYGIDTGLSNDFSVLAIISESGRLQNMVRVHGEDLRDIGQRFISEIKRYNNITGYVESNGIGAAMYEEIRRAFRTTQSFVTTNDTKVQGIRGLIQDMESSVLELPSKELFPYLYNELAAFTYKTSPTGKIQFSHPVGYHDDTVMALMMANQARNQLKISATSKIYVGRR